MKYSNREEKERNLVEMLDEEDPIRRLMMFALICSDAGESGAGLVGGYTRGDFKRAIKRLRVAQKFTLRYAADYEAAIAHIRREWLHREVVA